MTDKEEEEEVENTSQLSIAIRRALSTHAREDDLENQKENLSIHVALYNPYHVVL